jgi:hypothetical protein
MIYVPVFIAVDTDDAAEAKRAAQTVVENSDFYESFRLVTEPAPGALVLEKLGANG